MSWMLRIVSWLLPDSMRSLADDADQWFRARVLLAACLCCVIILLPLIYFEVRYVGFTSRFAFIHYINLSVLIFPLLLRVHKLPIKYTAAVTLTGLFFTVNSFIYFENILSTTTYMWLPIIAMCSFYLSGAPLTAVFIIAMIIAHTYIIHLWGAGKLSYTQPPVEQLLTRVIADVSGTMIMGALVSYLYRESHQLIYRSLEESKTEIIRQKEQLAQSAKMVALGEMAGGIAHEINNPLMVIVGRSEQLRLLIKQLDIPQKAQLLAISESIQSTTDKISHIISGMRKFARDTSDEQMYETSMADIVHDALTLCGERFRNHDVQIITPSLPDLKLQCRPIQISQIMVNLLSNSFHAVQTCSHRWIRISIEVEATLVRILFEDSGPGVPADLIDKIFQPFFTTKPVGSGTGLGLSLSLGIAKQHGGNLAYDSNAQVCRFVLELPLRQPSSAALT